MKLVGETIEVILFDIGGVLVDFAGFSELEKLLPTSMDQSDIRKKWIESPAIVAFEQGEIDRTEFAARFMDEWGLALEHRKFEELFKSWITGLLPGIEDLLLELRKTHHLACLSNTNELHWHTLMTEFKLGSLLDEHFASHLMGLTKPGSEIFRQSCEKMNVNPSNVVFFDDGIENVDGARAAGLHAFKVKGQREVHDALAELGLYSVP